MAPWPEPEGQSRPDTNGKYLQPLVAAEKRLVPVLGHTFAFTVTYGLVQSLVTTSTNAALLLMLSVMAALTATVGIESVAKSAMTQEHDIKRMLTEIVVWASTFLITTGSMFIANLFAHVLSDTLAGVTPIWSAFYFIYGLTLFYSALISQN